VKGEEIVAEGEAIERVEKEKEKSGEGEIWRRRDPYVNFIMECSDVGVSNSTARENNKRL
jgi:hypothetical protein